MTPTKELINSIYNLYVITSNHYLILLSNGKYISVIYNKKDKTKNEKNTRPLLPYMIENHLKGSNTVGVFSGQYFTKFICFDVDFIDKKYAKWVVHKIIDALTQIGINRKYIHISFSGKKGFHVEIFYDKPVSLKINKQLYNLVLKTIDHDSLKEYGKVELRPTYTQGIKIPLGCNFTNSDQHNNYCYYCEHDTLGAVDDNQNYLLQIEKFNIENLFFILNEYEEQLFYDNVKNIDKEIIKTEEIISNHKPLSIYQQNENEYDTIESIETLERVGLTGAGLRHNSLLKLCKYYKYLGCTAQQNENDLVAWMKKQDKGKYSTSWTDVLDDIHDIVEYIYQKNISLTIPKKDIAVSFQEIKEILKVENKSEKLLLYAMVVHSKRYATTTGIFYMTFEQMVKTTGISLRQVKRLVLNLTEQKLVERIKDKDQYQKGSHIKKPNKYRITMLLEVEETELQPTNYLVPDDNYNINFIFCLYKFFPNNELKYIIPRRQYEYFNDQYKRIS